MLHIMMSRRINSLGNKTKEVLMAIGDTIFSTSINYTFFYKLTNFQVNKFSLLEYHRKKGLKTTVFNLRDA